jgi:uncharacterized Zn-binding protein involved in type VI secretion
MPGAARLGDAHACPHPGAIPLVITTCGKVFVNKRFAIRVGDAAGCSIGPDPVVLGDFTVFMQGMPCARKTDLTMHGGSILAGSEDVLVGDGASAAAAGAGAAGVEADTSTWSTERCAELWAALLDQNQSLSEVWQRACAQDERTLSAEPPSDPSEDFARFVMAWAHSEPRLNIGRARSLFHAFPARYRALDVLLPNGLPPPAPRPEPAPESPDKRDNDDDPEEAR